MADSILSCSSTKDGDARTIANQYALNRLGEHFVEQTHDLNQLATVACASRRDPDRTSHQANHERSVPISMRNFARSESVNIHSIRNALGRIAAPGKQFAMKTAAHDVSCSHS